jgi:phage terminase large subunit GpA-like protein
MTIHIDPIKDTMAARLKFKTPEDGGHMAGFLHFPITERLDLEFFEQLTNEKRVKVMRRGREVKEWKLASGKRCEAWDCLVYAYAAYQWRFPIIKTQIDKRLEQYKGSKVAPILPNVAQQAPIEEVKEQGVEQIEEEVEQPKRQKSNWAYRWRQ